MKTHYIWTAIFLTMGVVVSLLVVSGIINKVGAALILAAMIVMILAYAASAAAFIIGEVLEHERREDEYPHPQ